MEDMMNLAIFCDAISVAGDKTMPRRLKAMVDLRGQDAFMANFAKAAIVFETPIGMFTNLIANNNKIDVQKRGTFPYCSRG